MTEPKQFTDETSNLEVKDNIAPEWVYTCALESKAI